MAEKGKIIAYTDGASLGNPGPGGWAVVLIFGDKRKELSGGFRLTTNNRMELYAAIQAMKAVKNRSYGLEVRSDSKYICDAVAKGWLNNWKKAGWKRKKTPIPNADLWKKFDSELSKLKVDFVWLKGHSGIEENERCDRLAKEEAKKENLPIDEGYESSLEKKELF